MREPTTLEWMGKQGEEHVAIAERALKNGDADTARSATSVANIWLVGICICQRLEDLLEQFPASFGPRQP